MQTWNRYCWLGLLVALFTWTGCQKKGVDARKKKVQALMKELKSEETSKREHAAQELEKLGPYARPAIPMLVDALKDEESRVKYAAARALGKTKMANPQAAIGGLTRALKDADAQMRIEAIHAITNLGGVAALACVGVLRVMAKDPDEDEGVKAAIKKALIKIH